eukprot:g81872.t1
MPKHAKTKPHDHKTYDKQKLGLTACTYSHVSVVDKSLIRCGCCIHAKKSCEIPKLRHTVTRWRGSFRAGVIHLL